MSAHVADDAVPGTTIRFFLSSTFADFQVERNVLQKWVFPQLRKLCAASGFRLQPIDLRWGVSEAAGTDRQTLGICFDELERCRALSPDFFLLIQLGERYGSYILPPQVPRSLVDRLLPHLAPEERSTFETLYRLDENAVPPEYVLLRAEGLQDAADEALRLVLVRASAQAGLAEGDRLLFEGSATHREIQRGLLGELRELGEAPGARREAGVLCVVRTFAGPPVGATVATYAAQDTDQADRVHQLTKAVLDRLPAEQVQHYEVVWDGERGPTFNEEALAAVYLGLLRPKLEAVIAARTAAREAAQASGRSAALLTNATFETERLAHFVGRDEPLAALDSYLATPATVPVVLAGPGGSGKSTLLARVAEQIRAAWPDAVVLVRYVGVTPGAEGVRTLLDGLRADLAAAYRQEIEPVQEEFERARAFREALSWAMSERPLVLVVDALDQLGPPPVPLDWLPETLPPHVHLIVSLLDEPDRPELATLLARRPEPQLVMLATMPVAEGDALLARWLAEARRTLQPTQHATVLAAFAQEGRPLYLRLAFEEAHRWRSFDDIAALPPLEPTIVGLVTARFRRLERRDAHGLGLTSHSLGLLRAAKNGLAEDELLAVLSRDAPVRRDLHRQSPSSPPITPDLPLPAALWARLYADLGSYLTEREADGARLLTYYHRQLADVAASLYLHAADGRGRRRDLARYFDAQPLLEGSQPNRRKLSELPTQQAAGGFTTELLHTLTDVSFLEQKIAYQRSAGALDDLALAPEDATLSDIAAAVRLGAHTLDSVPDQTESQFRGRLPEAVRDSLHDPPDRRRLRLDSPSLAPVGGPLVRTMKGHTRVVSDCVFSPDGRLALSAVGGSGLRLWDVATGQTVRELEAGWTPCAFSPDGQMVLSAGGEGSGEPLWDVASGKIVRELEWDTGGENGLIWENIHRGFTFIFSPDGRLVLAVAVGGVGLWDVASGHRFCLLEGATTPYAFSPDGRLVLCTVAKDEKTMRLWDVARGKTVRVLKGHTDWVNAVAFSPDGRLALSASSDRTLRLWDVARGKTVRVLKGHISSVRSCAFSPDGRLVLSGTYGKWGLSGPEDAVHLWDVARGKTVHVLAGSRAPCAFSPDGRLVLSIADDHDSAVQLWDAANAQMVCTLQEGRSPFAFSPDAQLVLTASDDETMLLWDVANAQKARARRRHTRMVRVCAFSPDGRLVISASDEGGSLWLWDVASGETVHELAGHTGAVQDCAFSPDGRMALTASDDNTLRLWNVASGQTVHVLRGHTSYVLACAFSPDGRLALSCGAGGDNTLRLWNVASGQTVHVLRGHTRPVVDCAFSPDGRLALSASFDSTLRVWDVASGETVRTLAGHTDILEGCAFSPDGRLALSAATDRTLRVWDVASGQCLRILAGHTPGVYVDACVFSPDGRLALSCGAGNDYNLRLWDVTSGETLHTFAGHTGRVNAWALSPDGRLALSAGDDYTLRLWDVASGSELARFNADASLHCCAYSPCEGRVVAGDYHGAVYILSVLGFEDSSPLPLSVLQPVSTSVSPESAPELPQPPAPVSAETAEKRKSMRRRWLFGRRR
jgi:WD40 repeat protein